MGTAGRSASVQGCFGAVYSEAESESSTSLPTYVAPILSAICRTTARSWLVKT